MIYILPLEKMDQRYTKQWYQWFKEVFEEEGVSFKYIDGEKIESNLNKTMFLDMKNTFVWKFDQLKKLFKEDLKDGDWIFLPDGEMPGIEAIDYFRKFYNKNVKIAEFWHAGTYDNWDLTYQKGLERIGSKLEEVWMDIADIIFVATNFHKELILKNRLVNPDKIRVVGNPVDVKSLREYEKLDKQGIVFTGRLSYEKGLDIIDNLNREVIKTQELNLTKEDYYNLLGKSKFVLAPSRQETFGYGVVEGMAMNTIPVVPNDLSFKDYVPKKYRYNSIDELYKILDSKEDKSLYKNVEKYDYKKVIKSMVNYIG